MLHKFSLRLATICLLSGVTFQANSQQKVLSMKEAVQIALDNYGTIKAKNNYANSSKETIKQSKAEYLPDFNISGQQDFGTINGQQGPLYGYRGFSSAASGQPSSEQHWNAAFGALYLANVSWDFFAFGKAKERIKVAKSVFNRDQDDLDQEKFQHEIRVASAYLTLQAAQRFSISQENNLKRALGLRAVVVARAKNGLNPGVDSSLANAEVSSAKIALTNSLQRQQEEQNRLIQYLGIAPQDFLLDSIFVTRVPASLKAESKVLHDEHPLLQYYQSRINLSNEQAKYIRTFQYPTFSVFSLIQSRGSGFDYNYSSQNSNAYTQSYTKGVNPTRSNYLFGIGMIWNLTSPLRVRHQYSSQKYISQALKDEYDLVDQQLKAQLSLAETRINNALNNYQEAPVQVKAASDAYLQKSVLYKNGLSNIVDITQALYTVNRAETDRDIAFSNVWQALLFKAAATGDFDIFINEF